MNSLEKLIELFRQFPGIGPRQARRFAYFILTRDQSYVRNLSALINEVKNETKECSLCHRFFISNAMGQIPKTCDICGEQNREKNTLMIVARDADLEVVEKSGTYNGLYFVLGGALAILDEHPEKKIRIKSLELRVKSDENLKEIILALNANPEGEHTADFVVANLFSTVKEKNIKISRLGHGLSTGAELEYVDPDTLKSALKNRY